MSIYQSTCERFICSPFASAVTGVLAALYLIKYPSFVSLIVTSAAVKAVDLLQKALIKYDLDRFKSFPRPTELEEEYEDETPQDEDETPQDEDEQPQDEEEHPQDEDEANDEREDDEYIPSHKPNLKRRTYNLRNRSD
jgi:hypothetical protein